MEIIVNGVKLYYEVSGQGHPLVMVHGNQEDLHIFDVLEKKLRSHFQIWRLDSRNHGKSQKGLPLTYRDLTSDMYHFIIALNIKNPYFFGFSDGGIIGFMLAMSHPDLLKGMVCAGSNTRPKGMKFKVVKAMEKRYLKDKDPFYRLMIYEPYIYKRDLRTIKVKTLLVVGSHDLILKKHTHMIHRQISSAKLIIMPDKRHDDYIVDSDDLYEILIAFYT